MGDSAKRIGQKIKEINAILQFQNINSDFGNISEVYNNNLLVWYIYESDSKESIDGSGIVITNGVLENPDNFIFSKTKDGFELSEVDFIDLELRKLSLLEYDKLGLIQRKQFDSYYNHLINMKSYYKEEFYKNEINKINRISNISDLIDFKKELKFQIKSKENQIELQKKNIEKHTVRAQQGLQNALTFEHKQLGTFESELYILKEKFHIVKKRIAEMKVKSVNNRIEENKIFVWYSEYELRQFIDIALRWKIDGIYNSRTDNNPYSTIFEYYVKEGRSNFEKFSTQLNNKLTENQNWKAIEIDLRSRFVGMLNNYIEWYYLNKENTQKFNPYNPYELMFSVIESTKNVILNYFPDIENGIVKTQKNEINQQNDSEIKHPKYNPNYWNNDCFELFKYLINEYYKGTTRQITNIWFFLKEYDRNNNGRKYILKITKDDYKIFIKENYKITITNFDKAPQKYEEKEYPTMNDHRQNFEESLK